MVEPIPCLELSVPGRDGRDGFLLRVPYRSGLVAELKDRLAGTHRYWDEGVAAWWIDARDERCVTAIVLHHFPLLARVDGPWAEPELISSKGVGTV